MWRDGLHHNQVSVSILNDYADDAADGDNDYDCILLWWMGECTWERIIKKIDR
jgi:hypothetical protein